MSTLFFDIQISGHHTEYIGHLIHYFKDHPPSSLVIFVVHPQFEKKFPDLVSEIRRIRSAQCVCVSEEEYQKATEGSLATQSFSALTLVSSYAKRYETSRVCLLSFNVFQIALIFARPRFKISGILFLQFHRMSKNNWKDRLKYLRKYWVTKLYTKNRQIERVFILNDSKTAEYLNHEFKTTMFAQLTDPIPKLEPADGFNTYIQYNIAPQRKILLHLGALDNRKGTLEFIQSGLHIRAELQNQLAFLIAGSPTSTVMEKQIEATIRHLNENTGITAIYAPGFLPDNKMKSMLDQCYGVVIPYKNPEASSGILGHAAASDKPVVATGKGLLKELIEQYQLGRLIEEVKPELIAAEIEALCQNETRTGEAAKFVAERTPATFVSTLIASGSAGRRQR